MDVTPMLQRNGETPLYVQLYRYLREQMEAGKLAKADKLPSIRRLSAHLGISKQTVETVYQQLLAEGYIESRPRSGLYVLPLDEPEGLLIRQAAPPNGGNNARNAPDETANRQAVPERTARFDFKYGDVDMEHFPLNSFRKCMNEALTSAVHAFGYGDPQGESPLREQIAEYLYRSRGVACAPEQLFLFAGTEQTLGFLCRYLPLAGTVAMEEPGYEGVRATLLSHGCKVAPIPLEHDGISVEELRESEACAVYVTPSHQFPQGMVLPVQKRMQLLQWAEERKGYILEDDYDSEFRYQGQPIPALKSLDRGERVIYLGTLSKSFIPAVRLSYAVVPPQLAAYLRECAGRYSQSVSPLLQHAIFRFMRDGYFDRHIRRMRRLYQHKHRKVLEAIGTHMDGRVEVEDGQAGLHLLLHVKERDFAELEKLAAAKGIRIYSPIKHWAVPGSAGSSSVILGFGGVKESEIEEGIRLLTEAWFGSGPA